MEFLKHLKNKYGTEEIKQAYLRCGLTTFYLPQMSDAIEFKNGLRLSIQGSFAHYCTPRETLPYDQYKSLEFALCTKKGFVDVKKFFDTDEYDEYFNCGVYGYVPVELIEKLYQKLKDKFGIKE